MNSSAHVPSESDIRPLMSRRDALMCLGGTVVVFGGVAADSLFAGRSENPVDLIRASDRLSQIPKQIERWDSTDGTIDSKEIEIAKIHGWLRREYRNQQTGYSVTVTLLNGPAGPMCVHPPTACFEGVGYTLSSGPTVTAAAGSDGKEVVFNRASFRADNSRSSETVRVHWGWSADGQWDAPANPRLTYRGFPALYKLYIVDRTTDHGADIKQAESFLHDALPVMRSVLSGAST